MVLIAFRLSAAGGPVDSLGDGCQRVGHSAPEDGQPDDGEQARQREDQPVFDQTLALGQSRPLQAHRSVGDGTRDDRDVRQQAQFTALGQ